MSPAWLIVAAVGLLALGTFIWAFSGIFGSTPPYEREDDEQDA